MRIDKIRNLLQRLPRAVLVGLMPKQKDPFELHLARRVGKQMRAVREARNIKVSDLAEVLGCSVRAVQSYEAGARRLSLADAVRVSYALSIDLEQLVYEAADLAKSLPRVRFPLKQR